MEQDDTSAQHLSRRPSTTQLSNNPKLLKSKIVYTLLSLMQQHKASPKEHQEVSRHDMRMLTRNTADYTQTHRTLIAQLRSNLGTIYQSISLTDFHRQNAAMGVITGCHTMTSTYHLHRECLFLPVKQHDELPSAHLPTRPDNHTT